VEIAVNEMPLVEAEPMTVGQELKAARARMGMSLSDLAAETRVPMRHLESIERSEFSALPGHTYTIGFVRSYARTVSLDDIAIVNALRAELSSGGHERYEAPLQNYEPTDPARVPSKNLAWTAASFAALVLAAYLIFRTYALQPNPEPQTPTSVPKTVPTAKTLKPNTTVDDTAVTSGSINENAPPPAASLVANPNQ
jgi:cytoskeleton protein RodZ